MGEITEENLEEPIIEEEILEEPGEGDYTPDYTYKFKDEVRNFDERFSPSIKTKEDEDAIRDLYTRADGLDSYKSKYSDLEGNYAKLEGQTQALTSGFETLQKLSDDKDMRGMMQANGVSKEMLLEYAAELLDEEELPESQRTLVEQNRSMKQKMAGLENSLAGMNSDQDRAAMERQVNEVNNLIKSDGFSPIAAAMEKFGFNVFDQIVTEGRNITTATQKEPSTAEVMSLMAQKYGKLVKQEELVTNNEEAIARKSTLPSINGTSSRAAGGKFKTLDDLKAYAETFEV